MRALCLLIGLILAQTSVASDRHAPNDVLAIDLSPFGFGQYSHHDLPLASHHPAQLVFLSDDLIAVSFAMPNLEPKLSTRKEAEGGGTSFNSVFINTKTGGLEGTVHKWGSFGHYSRLLALADGKFLLRTADHIWLYSQDAHLITDSNLPTTKVWPTIPYPDVIASTDGTAIYVIFPSDKTHSEVDVLDSAKLAVIEKFVTPYIDHATANKLSFAFSTHAVTDGFVLLRERQDQGPRILLHETTSRCLDQPTFVAPDKIAISGGCKALRIIDLNAKLLFQTNLKGEFAGPVQPSADGSRFLVHLNKEKGGSTLFDVPSHSSDFKVEAFDTTTYGLLGSISLPADADHDPLASAFSPDGKQWCFIQRTALKCEAF